MIIEIKVIPSARRNLWKEDATGIKIYLTAPALEGRANEALVAFLASRFGVKPGAVEIIKGLKSQRKVINIEGI